jgi:hypothetical protein
VQHIKQIRLCMTCAVVVQAYKGNASVWASGTDGNRMAAPAVLAVQVRINLQQQIVRGRQFSQLHASLTLCKPCD